MTYVRPGEGRSPQNCSVRDGRGRSAVTPPTPAGSTVHKRFHAARPAESAARPALVPAGLPEPLLTLAVRSSVASIPDRTVTFGFKPISKSFVDKLRDEGLYTSDNSIDSAAIGYIHVRAAAESIAKCGKKNILCVSSVVEKFKLADSPLPFHGWKDHKGEIEQTLKVFVKGELKSAEQFEGPHERPAGVCAN